jgi:nucleotide-binding universal stress UspA family protein
VDVACILHLRTFWSRWTLRRRNAAALKIALQLAAGQTRFTLLHVIETIEHAEGKEIDEFYAGLEAAAQQRLSNASQRFTEGGLSVETRILYGRRGPEIVRFVTDEDVDLVVLSSHRIDSSQGAKSWATLSYQIATFCPCPVLLVK